MKEEAIEIELLRITSSRKFAEEMKAELTHLMSRELDKTLTRAAGIYIRTIYDIGMNFVFPKKEK